MYKLTMQEVDRKLAAMSSEDREISLPPRRKGNEYWDDHKGIPYKKSIRLLEAPYFSARGMRQIYGRYEYWQRSAGFNGLSCGMEMWMRKDGLVFIRFCSPGKRESYRTYELVGLTFPKLSKETKRIDEKYVPELLRDLYEGWIIECCEYPDDVT